VNSLPANLGAMQCLHATELLLKFPNSMLYTCASEQVNACLCMLLQMRLGRGVALKFA
jgi:hypothetical protein